MQTDNMGFVKWAVHKHPHLHYLNKWIMSDYGSYENLEAELAGFIWELGDSKGKAQWVASLVNRFKNEYRRNVSRFNLYDEAAQRMDHNNLAADTLLQDDLDEHGFSTLGDYSRNFDIDLGETKGEGDTQPLGAEPSWGASPSEATQLLNRYMLTLDDTIHHYTWNGSDYGTSRTKFQKWWDKRTEQEKDILNTWLNCAPLRERELAEICGVDRKEVQRVVNLLFQWGYRHRDHLHKAEPHVLAYPT